jgi:uncharacterized membrane protein YkgB
MSSEWLIRVSLFIIFFWFGFLKVIDLSPATDLVLQTIYWMPFLTPIQWVYTVGIWEMFIGLFFLFKRTTVMAMILLFTQMIGTFMPLFILPEVTFQSNNPLLPTLEGQYIMKNIIIIASSITISEGRLK